MAYGGPPPPYSQTAPMDPGVIFSPVSFKAETIVRTVIIMFNDPNVKLSIL